MSEPNIELRNKLKKGILTVLGAIGGLLLLSNLVNAFSIGAPSATTNNAAGVGGTGGGSATSPGGADTDIQYNKSGAFFGDSNLTWNYSTGVLGVDGATIYNDNTHLNLFIGNNAGAPGNTQPYNVAIGTNAMGGGGMLNTGQINVAIGVDALQNNTSAVGNVAIGVLAAQAITSGYNNVAIGQRSLTASKTDFGNVAIGGYALNAVNGGPENTGIGNGAGGAIVGGASNVAIGYNTLPAETSGNGNMAIGTAALASQNGASYNVAIGVQAGVYLTTGGSNILIGLQAGYNGAETAKMQTASNCILIGANTYCLADGYYNSIIISGIAEQLTSSNQTIIGNPSTTQSIIYGNLSTPGSVSPGSNGSAGTAGHLFSGTGSPNGAVTGVAGDYYLRVDYGAITHIYVCSGGTTWTAIL